jgi:hypothetical protein
MRGSSGSALAGPQRSPLRTRHEAARINDRTSLRRSPYAHRTRIFAARRKCFALTITFDQRAPLVGKRRPGTRVRTVSHRHRRHGKSGYQREKASNQQRNHRNHPFANPASSGLAAGRVSP